MRRWRQTEVKCVTLAFYSPWPLQKVPCHNLISQVVPVIYSDMIYFWHVCWVPINARCLPVSWSFIFFLTKILESITLPFACEEIEVHKDWLISTLLNKKDRIKTFSFWAQSPLFFLYITKIQNIVPWSVQKNLERVMLVLEVKF